MLAITLALITFVGWGVGDVFGTAVSRKIGGFSTSLWLYFGAFILYSFIAPFKLDELENLTPELFIVNLAISVAGVLGYIMFYEGLRVGNSTIVGTISSSSAAIAVLASILFFGESVSGLELTAIIVIFLGIILTSEDLSQFKKGRFDRGMFLALGAMLFWGIYFAFIKVPASELGWFWPNYFGTFAFPLIFLFMKFRKTGLELPRGKYFFSAIAMSVLLIVGYFSYTAAVIKGDIAVVSPIAGSSPVLFAVLSYFVFRDRISKQQVIGVVTALFGIVVLSFLNI